MEEGLYQMSLVENFLVLLIIGLWLFAVIILVRKLERICNPPSIFVNYSLHTKTSLSPSTLHQRYPNDSTPTSPRPSPLHFIRSISEPTPSASPRTTIDLRSPSDICIPQKTYLSEQILSPSLLELGKSKSSLDLPRHTGYRIHVETIRNKTLSPNPLLSPNRMPSIIRRSLLDLHRRTATIGSSTHYVVTSIPLENRIIATGPTVKRKYQRENAVDQDENLKSKTKHLITIAKTILTYK